MTAVTLAAVVVVGGCDGSDGAANQPVTAGSTNESAPTSADGAAQVAIDLTPAPGYQRVPMGSEGILVTLGGATGPTVPKLIAGPGHTSVEVDRRRAFATERYGKLPPAPVPDTTTEVRIAGLPGFEMVGRGSGGRKIVYGVVLFTDGGYIVIGGDQPDQHPDQLPAFRAMARSLTVDVPGNAPSSPHTVPPSERPQRPESPATPTVSNGPPPAPPTPPTA